MMEPELFKEEDFEGLLAYNAPLDPHGAVKPSDSGGSTAGEVNDIYELGTPVLSALSDIIGNKRVVRSSNQRGLSEVTNKQATGKQSEDKPGGSLTPQEALEAVLPRILSNGVMTFREKQSDIVESVLRGINTLAILPTAHGKSLCYQLPAAIHKAVHLYERSVCLVPSGRHPGRGDSTNYPLTIVISPLVSLMQDQVNSLPSGLVGVAITKATKQVAMKKIMDTIIGEQAKEYDKYTTGAQAGGSTGRGGAYDVIFVAPERFVEGREFRVFLAKVASRVRVVCIDEAHCISQWAHNFRPSYMAIHSTLNAVFNTSRGVRAPTILALTATASSRAVDEIVSQLEIGRTVRYTPPHEHLRLSGRAVERGQMYEQVCDVVERAVKPVLIYVQAREEAEAVATALRTKLLQQNSNGGSSEGTEKALRNICYYHADMTAGERNTVQANFMKGTTSVLVATIAFGMGINKSDIRTVVHFNLPSSLEMYVQEIGRAGRDGKRADCITVWDREDRETYFNQHSKTFANYISEIQLKCAVEAIVAKFAHTTKGNTPRYATVLSQQLANTVNATIPIVDSIVLKLCVWYPNLFEYFGKVAQMKRLRDREARANGEIDGAKLKKRMDGSEQSIKEQLAIKTPLSAALSVNGNERKTISPVSLAMELGLPLDTVLDEVEALKQSNRLQVSNTATPYAHCLVAKVEQSVIAEYVDEMVLKLWDSFNTCGDTQRQSLMRAHWFYHHCLADATDDDNPSGAMHTDRYDVLNMLVSADNTRDSSVLQAHGCDDVALHKWVEATLRPNLSKQEALGVVANTFKKVLEDRLRGDASGRSASKLDLNNAVIGIAKVLLGVETEHYPAESWAWKREHWGRLKGFDIVWLLKALKTHMPSGV